MKVKSHVKLAELALSNLDNFPDGFSKSMFNFGLMIVDNSWHVKTHPHYMQKSLNYIIKKIEKLIYIKQFNKYYSMQLGIVVHYLCDFCCHAHITGRIGNASRHLRYESQLQAYLLRNYDMLKDNLCKNTDTLDSETLTIESIKLLIENMLKTYMAGTPSFIWDIDKAVQLTSFVCSSIFCVNHNLSNSLEDTVSECYL